MKNCRYVALAVFTFAIGVAMSPIRFYPESIACGLGSTTGYRSSLLIQTSRSHLPYKSEAEARRAFDDELSQALTIYDRSPKMNKQGVLIEQRAVYLTYDPVNDEYCWEIMWLDGTTLNGIHSRSYTHVMEFERQYF